MQLEKGNYPILIGEYPQFFYYPTRTRRYGDLSAKTGNHSKRTAINEKKNLSVDTNKVFPP